MITVVCWMLVAVVCWLFSGSLLCIIVWLWFFGFVYLFCFLLAGYCCFVGWFLAPTVFVGGWCGWSLLVDYLMDNFCVLLVGWFWLVVIVCCGWLFTGCCLLLLFGRLVNLFFFFDQLFVL